MIVGLDIDGVLANFTRGYIDRMNQIQGTSCPLDFKPQQWDFEGDAGFTRETVKEAWRYIKASTDFWFNLEPFDKSLKLTRFCDTHDVYFITARVGPSVKAQTEGFLRWWYDVSNPTVLISADKGPLAVGLGLEAFLDDRDVNLEEVKEALPSCRVVALDYPYNRHVDGPRVTSVREFLAEVDGV